ncbi:PSP1-domain-containing protein, partial [Rhizodiscina lignyota]
LYIVTFKCARADVYYIPANTGLQVKVGDMVVVEGDRGIDLGTVSHARMSMSEAKQLKEAATDQHFNWLMIQSPHADHDIRPKMIRRLAQNHEIQMLRDKEGAEAKAKRVCQSKVSDHGLNMEILDAEFQFDWKKLTYFYYAESYVNFNELVTDLFKVYKTRIWMSAINP